MRSSSLDLSASAKALRWFWSKVAAALSRAEIRLAVRLRVCAMVELKLSSMSAVRLDSNTATTSPALTIDPGSARDSMVRLEPPPPAPPPPPPPPPPRSLAPRIRGARIRAKLVAPRAPPARRDASKRLDSTAMVWITIGPELLDEPAWLCKAWYARRPKTMPAATKPATTLRENGGGVGLSSDTTSGRRSVSIA